MRNKNGITLIALVVTVIILLILAGISMSMLKENNSVITRANEAKKKTIEAQNIEELNTEILKSSKRNGTFDINTLKNNLENIGAKVSGNDFPLSVEYNEKNYQVTSDGELKNIGNISELLTEEDYLIVMEASKSKFAGKTNVGTIEEFKTLVESGQFNYKNAYLYENIDLNGSKWTSIGNSAISFDKLFDGRNYTISGLDITSSNQYVGFFSGNSGTIKDVTINGKIEGNASGVGGIAGVNYGIIDNCTSNISIVGNEYLGGITGYNSETGTIRKCTSNNDIKGTQIAGGVAGGSDGIIENCLNTGNVETTSNKSSTITNGAMGAGGIAGIISGRKYHKLR